MSTDSRDSRSTRYMVWRDFNNSDRLAKTMAAESLKQGRLGNMERAGDLAGLASIHRNDAQKYAEHLRNIEKSLNQGG